jgi:hypothetical protein
MKTDQQLQQSVIDELTWDPSAHASEIGVIVKDGVVTLDGEVSSFAEKWSAERAAQRVTGVQALAVGLEVKLSALGKRSDSDIARSAPTLLLRRQHLGAAGDHVVAMLVGTAAGQGDVLVARVFDRDRHSCRECVRQALVVTHPQLIKGEVLRQRAGQRSQCRGLVARGNLGQGDGGHGRAGLAAQGPCRAEPAKQRRALTLLRRSKDVCASPNLLTAPQGQPLTDARPPCWGSLPPRLTQPASSAAA